MGKARAAKADVGVDFVGGLRFLVAVLRLVGDAPGVAFTAFGELIEIFVLHAAGE